MDTASLRLASASRVLTRKGAGGAAFERDSVGLWLLRVGGAGDASATKEVRVATDMQGGRGPATVSTTEVLEGLNDLLQLNHDAVGAYDIAIEKLENADHATQISGFKQDHLRHIRELNAAIEQLGGTPKNEPHATGVLKQGMQSLGAVGGDKGILIAWRTNELQVRTKYDNYAAKATTWPGELKRMVDEQALDEERHYRWVADELERMGVAPGEGAETHLANKAREQMGSLAGKAQQMTQHAGDRARETARQAADTVRTRAADGLDRAASKLDQLADRQGASGGAKARAAGAAHGVADGIESTAEYLRSGDSEALRRDVEQQVRTSPAQTLLAAFGVGFVIGRILR
jgi:rubrerythrin